jgi:protein SCO1/2
MAAVSETTGAAGTRPLAGRQWLWLILPVAALLGLGALMVPRGSPPAPALTGTDLHSRPAPDFRLTDQFGHPVQLAALRGHPVVLTFLSATCTTLCPVVAETIHRSLTELGSAGRDVAVLAVSTDPEANPPAAVKRFSREYGLYQHWHFLNARRLTLARVWSSYYIYAAPASAPQSVRDAHTSATYLIDSDGRERVLMTGNPGTGSLVRDLRILLGRSPSGSVPLIAAPEPGHPAPIFALSSLSGGRIRLSQYRGDAVLINFWASWCGPCRSEMPMLSGWYRRLRRNHFQVLGVNDSDSKSAARTFASRLKIPYPIVVDSNGTVPALYSVSGLPTSVLIDRQGIVRWVKQGVLARADLARSILPVVDGAGHA